jgi:hypothetical protein
MRRAAWILTLAAMAALSTAGVAAAAATLTITVPARTTIPANFRVRPDFTITATGTDDSPSAQVSTDRVTAWSLLPSRPCPPTPAGIDPNRDASVGLRPTNVGTSFTSKATMQAFPGKRHICAYLEAGSQGVVATDNKSYQVVFGSSHKKPKCKSGQAYNTHTHKCVTKKKPKHK